MFLTAEGLKVYVETAGPEDAATTVLLLHGFPDSHKLWQAQILHLAAAGHRVIAPDLPGFGASDKPAGLQHYKVEAVVQVVASLLDQLQAPAKVVVVGHDWGAAVAWAFAFTHPDRVAKLAVLSVGFPGTVFCANPKQRELSWYMLFFQHPEAEELLAADNWALMRQLWGKNSNEQEMQDYIDALSQPGALTAGLNWYRANLNLAALASTKPALPPIKLDMPVLGLWSSDEAYLTEDGMIASQHVVAEGRWVYKRVEGAGHWMMRDAPGTVNELLAEFVADKVQH